MTSGSTITEVATTFLSLPLEKPVVTAAIPSPAIDTPLDQVRTQDGHEGVAWSFAFGRSRVASLVRLIEDLGELALGQDALAPEALRPRMTSAVGFIGQRGLASLAMSTLDIVCWDIAGKVAGLPVYRCWAADQ